MNTALWIRTLGFALLLTSVAAAQEDDAQTPSPSGSYDMYGTIKAGYRFVSVESGDNTGAWFDNNASNLFREQFGLVRSDSSPTLQQMIPFSLTLFGKRREGETGPFDQITLNAEMNPIVAGGSLRVRKLEAYDLNVGFHRINFFMDRYDSLFTDLRRYESHRNDLNASLNITATDFLDIDIGYHGIGHGGTLQLPRPMFVEGAPSNIVLSADFRNYYLMELPRTDWNNDFHGAINLGFDNLSISVGGGYNSFTEDYEVTPVATLDSLSLNFKDTNNRPLGENSHGIVGDLTARERMFHYQHTEDRETKGPYFFGQVVATPLDILSLTGDVRVDKLEMTNKVKTDQMLEYRKTTAAKSFQFYRALYQGTIDNNMDRFRASLVATLFPITDLSITAGWKMDNYDIESTGEYTLEFDTTSSIATQDFKTVLKDSITKSDWFQRNDVPTQTFLGNINFAPIKELNLNAGARFSTRNPDVVRREGSDLDSVFTTNLSKKTTELGLDFGASYRPIRELRLRARVELLNRKAEFGEDSLASGPAAGTETDLEPRTTPEKVFRFNGAVDYQIMSGFDVGVRFGMFDGSSDLNESMFVIDGAGGKVELVNKGTNISGSISYEIDENTAVRLNAESRSTEFSIPTTFTRGQMLITPLFGLDPTAPARGATNAYDSSTVIISQKTDDIFIDLSAHTRVIDALTIGAGLSYLNVTGSPTITTEVRAKATTPTGEGDVTRVGGPFSRMQISGSVGYDITSHFGVAVDVMYALQNEEELIDPAAGMRFYGYNDYSGLAAALTLVYNL